MNIPLAKAIETWRCKRRRVSRSGDTPGIKTTKNYRTSLNHVLQKKKREDEQQRKTRKYQKKKKGGKEQNREIKSRAAYVSFARIIKTVDTFSIHGPQTRNRTKLHTPRAAAATRQLLDLVCSRS